MNRDLRSSAFRIGLPIAALLAVAIPFDGLVFAQPKVSADHDDTHIKLRGRVMTEDGIPVANATLSVLRSRTFPFANREAIREARVNNDGTFLLRVARARFAIANSPFSVPWRHATVIARADGLGIAWLDLKDVATTDELLLTLPSEEMVQAQILDLEGNPIVNADVRVASVVEASQDELTKFVEQIAAGVPIPSTAGGNARSLLLPKNWAAMATRTDGEGKCRIRSLSRNHVATLKIEDKSIAFQRVHVVAGRDITINENTRHEFESYYGRNFVHFTKPSRLIRGTVRAKSTGNPVPGVLVTSPNTWHRVVTDAEGRYELIGASKATAYYVDAVPSPELPFVVSGSMAGDRPALDPISVDIDLVSGLLFEGTLKESDGTPVTAEIVYYALRGNPHAEAAGWALRGNTFSFPTQQRNDGSFMIRVLPGPGAVLCRTDDKRYEQVVADAAAYFQVPDYGDDSVLLPAIRGIHGVRLAIPQAGSVAVTLIDPGKDEKAMAKSMIVRQVDEQTQRNQ